MSETTHINFSCGCREWVIFPQDEKGVNEKPSNTIIEHECERIIVYRTYRGVKRFFMKKVIPTPPIDTNNSNDNI